MYYHTCIDLVLVFSNTCTIQYIIYLTSLFIGNYEFRIVRHVSTAISGEFWLSSDSNPSTLVKITELTYDLEVYKYMYCSIIYC